MPTHFRWLTGNSQNRVVSSWVVGFATEIATGRIVFSVVAIVNTKLSDAGAGLDCEFSLIRWHAKYALDASGIADGDPDVSFFEIPQPGTRILLQ